MIVLIFNLVTVIHGGPPLLIIAMLLVALFAVEMAERYDL